MTDSSIPGELISELELRARLTNFEDPFVERKVSGDIKDCLKTAIAFANTLPNGPELTGADPHAEKYNSRAE